jgi:hypothetical protein
MRVTGYSELTNSVDLNFLFADYTDAYRSNSV